MSRINQKNSFTTSNPEGGLAYILPLKERFVTELMTCFFKEPKFYGDTTPALLNDGIEMINRDHTFFTKAIIYAREVMHLRTAPTALLGLLAMSQYHDSFYRAGSRVITRPDQLLDLLAYLKEQDRKLINMRCVKKLVAELLNTFDEYQLSKYNRKGNFTLKDAIILSHPKPISNQQSQLFKAILDDTLNAPYTWEVEISKRGNKAEVWDELISSGKIGYMALLRNLRNIINSGAKQLPAVLSILSDPERVIKSKQLPYRFYSAYRTLQKVDGVQEVLSALDLALQHSVVNCQDLNGISFISADNSGSMSDYISGRSVITLRDIANLFQSIMNYINNGTITSVFGKDFSIVTVDPKSSIISNAEVFNHTNVGYSTNGYKAIEWLINNNKKVDRLIFMTDCILWDDYNDCLFKKTFNQYKNTVANDVWLHIVDIAGYGTTPLQIDYKNKINLISGFSDNILKYIWQVENGSDSMIDDINYCNIG